MSTAKSINIVGFIAKFTAHLQMDANIYTSPRNICGIAFESNITNQNMRRLEQLLSARIVLVGDVLYFTFKKHMFTGQIAQGGLIWHCTWQKPGETALKIFQSQTSIHQQPYVRTFESLTDWTETCIQECLDEYHTRYSSWKRVRHQRLQDQPMEVLFKHLQRSQMASNQANGQDTGRSVLLYEQIAAQQHHIDTLKNANEDWIKWFRNKFPGETLPIDIREPQPQQNNAPTQNNNGPAAQPFVLTSESGQYMVLHRLNEVAPPECMSWLKNNGSESFQEILKGIKQSVTFEPPSQTGPDEWGPANKDTSKRFVHNFFKSK